MRMLTGMSPIAAVAAHTAIPALNTAFYATAATVIPVLFLALAVQGGTYENLMKAFSEAFRRWMVPGRWLRTLPAMALCVAAAGAAIILLDGAVAEVQAIYALYQQQARTSVAQNVLLAITFLVITTAAGPLLAFYRAVIVPLARANKWIFTGQPTLVQPEATNMREAVRESPNAEDDQKLQLAVPSGSAGTLCRGDAVQFWRLATGGAR